MSTYDPPTSEPESYACDNVTIERVGDSIKLRRNDIAGGCIHLRCDSVDQIAAVMRTLAEN